MKKQQGIGIIELMVSITIGAFILAGVLQLYFTSTQNVSAFEGSSRIQENARYVFSRMEKDIGQAGNMGCFSFTTLNQLVEKQVSGSTVRSTVNRRLDNRITSNTAAGQLYDFTRFIDGQNNTEPGFSGATTTDRLIVRYASMESKFPILGKAAGAFVLPVGATSEFSASGGIAIVGDCSTVSMFEVSSIDASNNQVLYSGSDFPQFLAESANSETLAKGISRAYVYGGDTGVVQYYIGTSAAGVLAGVTCTSDSRYCALFRKANSGAQLELVEGVQNLQIEYGRIDDTGNLVLLDSAGVDAVTTGGVADADYAWSKIDRVRVTAEFNSIANATTNEGLDLLTRTYSRIFAIHNQIPVCADCKGI